MAMAEHCAYYFAYAALAYISPTDLCLTSSANLRAALSAAAAAANQTAGACRAITDRLSRHKEKMVFLFSPVLCSAMYQ